MASGGRVKLQASSTAKRREGRPSLLLVACRTMGLIGHNAPLGLLGLPAWMWRDYPHVILLGIAVGMVFLMWLCMGESRATAAKKRR
jgi:hypothetical protein